MNLLDDKSFRVIRIKPGARPPDNYQVRDEWKTLRSVSGKDDTILIVRCNCIRCDACMIRSNEWTCPVCGAPVYETEGSCPEAPIACMCGAHMIMCDGSAYGVSVPKGIKFSHAEDDII